MANQNDALAKAVHDLVNARPDSVRGRIVYVLDDIDDEKIHRATEASGKVDAEFLCNFVSTVTEYFASLMVGSGMPPHTAAITLLSAAKQGLDAALGDTDADNGDEDTIQ